MLLNYTVVLDGAPGPNDSFPLYLRPDPVFIQLAEDSQQYQVSSGDSITIEVCMSKQREQIVGKLTGCTLHILIFRDNTWTL